MEFLTIILLILTLYSIITIRVLKKDIKANNIKINDLRSKLNALLSAQMNVEGESKGLENEKIDSTISASLGEEDALQEPTLPEKSNSKVKLEGDPKGQSPENSRNLNYRQDISTNVNASLEKVIASSTDDNKNIIDKIKSSGLNKKKNVFTIESIITKLGILLLLIGIGFIFKYSYDSGVITEKVVLIMGIIFGLGLMFTGEVVRRKSRELLSQVLYGGGLATLFITTYSAYQVYGLISSLSTFISMILITFLTFVVAIYLDSMVISIIGLLGALMTPFFVDLKFLGLYGLGLYMVILSMASMLIYIYKKWRFLQVSLILGIYSINLFLISSVNNNADNAFKLSALILILYLIFNSVEYMLIYLNKILDKDKIISPLIIGILPIITMAQLSQILDISNAKWSILCVILAMIYIVMWEMLFRKNGYSLISDILLGVAAAFLLLACTIYFEGELEAMTVLIIAILLAFIGEKRSHKYISYASHLIASIGFILSLINMISDSFAYDYQWTNMVGYTLIFVLLVTASLMQKNIIRMIYGVLSLELYMLVFIQALVYQLTKESDLRNAALIIAYALTIVLLALLSKKKKLIPQLSIPLITLVLPLLRVVYSLYLLWIMEFELFDFIAFISYGLILYAISISKYFDWDKRAKILFRISSVAIIQISIITDVYILLDNVAYGLLIVGLINIIMHHYDPDKELIHIALVNKIFAFIWVGSMVIYTLSNIFGHSFDIKTALVDAGLLIVLYYIGKMLKVKREYRLVLHWIVYIIIVNQNFAQLEFGSTIVTLLWAAYGISSLTFAVKKNEKNIANIALVMIVFVAGKFVLIDISQANILWKIITSMIFGSALLVISYVLQPVFAKRNNLNKED